MSKHQQFPTRSTCWLHHTHTHTHQPVRLSVSPVGGELPPWHSPTACRLHCCSDYYSVTVTVNVQLNGRQVYKTHLQAYFIQPSNTAF